MRISIILFCLVLLATSACLVVKCDEETSSDETVPEEDIEISRKCYSVLLVSKTSLGVGLTYFFSPAVLCTTAGFCPVGIKANSLAAAWQSTIGNVAKGSVFSYLQSISMGGIGGTKFALSGAAIGGLHTTSLKQVCEYVDSTKEESKLGQMIVACEAAVTNGIELKQGAQEYCDSSEVCTALSESVGKGTNWVSSQFNLLSNKVQKLFLEREIKKIQSLYETQELKCWERNHPILGKYARCVKELELFSSTMHQKIEEYRKLQA